MWRIWYWDSSTYSSDDGPPETAPGYGVQAIAQPDKTPGVGNVGYLVLRKFDWYLWHTEDEEWFGVMGDSSMHSQILSRQPVVGIGQGMRISDKRFDEISAEAAAWAAAQGLPLKSGNRVEEAA